MKSKKKNITNVIQLAKGSADAFKKFLPIAREIPANEVLVAYDPELALHNARNGTKAMLAHKDLATVASLVPEDEVRETLELAEATLFAAGVPEKEVKQIPELLDEAAEIRNKLLKAADSLASFGLLSTVAVEEIRKGRGAIDRARDCCQLAELFRGSWTEIEAKTAVTTEHIDRAQVVGDQLLALLKPSNAKVTRVPTLAEGDRNRLYTLLVRRDDRIRRAAVWLFGFDRVDEQVPHLRTQVRARRSTEGEPSGAESVGAKPASTANAGEKPSATNAGANPAEASSAKPGETTGTP